MWRGEAGRPVKESKREGVLALVFVFIADEAKYQESDRSLKGCPRAISSTYTRTRAK